jgi:hypothetical protein
MNTPSPLPPNINHAAPPGAAGLDQPIATSGHCPNCGSTNLMYDSHYTPDPYSYRAFSVCRDCGNADEF